MVARFAIGAAGCADDRLVYHVSSNHTYYPTTEATMISVVFKRQCALDESILSNVGTLINSKYRLH